MPHAKSRPPAEDEIYTTVTDEQFDDLMDLSGQQVVQAVLWQDSMAAALEIDDSDDTSPDTSPDTATDTAKDEEESVFDLDLYLKDGVYFELYGVQLYPSLESDPIVGHSAAQAYLRDLIDGGLWLDDLGVDEEDGLVLILCKRRNPLLYVPAGAWTVDEWDELPDDTTGDDFVDESDHEPGDEPRP